MQDLLGITCYGIFFPRIFGKPHILPFIIPPVCILAWITFIYAMAYDFSEYRTSYANSKFLPKQRHWAIYLLPLLLLRIFMHYQDTKQAQIDVLKSEERTQKEGKKRHVEGVIVVGQCQGWRAAALMSAFIQAFSEQARDTFSYMCRYTLEFACFFPTENYVQNNTFNFCALCALIALQRCHTRSQ